VLLGPSLFDPRAPPGAGPIHTFDVFADAASGAFLGLADAHVPAELADLFTELPDFREDVSSTQLRAAAAAGGAAAAAAGR